jgi:sialic acid synthase SpsE/mannose-6-phosphate isomerase-like protein (cupin superfamily)
MNLDSLSPINPLIILDIANNHDGSLEHGKKIIRDAAEVAKEFNFKVGIKFQYRNLETFIHPDFKERRDIKYVDRFLSSKLEWDQLKELKNEVEKFDLISICTPFDEFSVSKVIEHEYQILKIASASFTDWPLLEAVSQWNGPIVASTAGATLEEIERVVSFFTNRKKSFALMHCVAAYPTEDKDLQLMRITKLKEKFSEIPIGYSTHENPDNTLAGPLALAHGAVILEKHIGSNEDGHSLNRYSIDQNQLKLWFTNLEKAIAMMGSMNPWILNNSKEIDALNGLRRYAFAKKPISKGETFDSNDVYFAIPGSTNNKTANQFGKYSKYLAEREILTNDPIQTEVANLQSNEPKVLEIRNKVLELIKRSRIQVPHNADLEISHHYGIEQFYKFGTCLITVINRAYCKKLLILLPGQTHPGMFHKQKDETFFLLFGDLDLKLNHETVEITEGQTVSIEPGVIHEFSSKGGAIIEEVSSTHLQDDSFYEDEKINSSKNRKTFVKYWLELK